MRGISVSLCIIAKNEEHCIADCISSACHLLTEIIVVDTGSTDQTKKIALQNGAVIFDYCWNDDFAAARNFAIQQAQSEWILVLDADEVLAPVSRSDFLKLLAEIAAEGCYVNVCSYLGDGDQIAEDCIVRLFKNKPEYRFEGTIHEQVAGSIKRHNGGNGLAFMDLTIRHFGYLKREMSIKSKFFRNAAIIKKALNESPCDPFLHFSLGIEYLQQNALKLGIHHLYTALTFLRGNEGYFRQVLFLLILGLMQDDNQTLLDVHDIIEKALYMFPNDADLLCLQGFELMQCAQYERSVAVLQKAIANVPELLPSGKIYALLGDACCLAGDVSLAEQYYFSACQLAPQEIYPFVQLLGIRQRQCSQFSWDTLSSLTSIKVKKEVRDALLEKGQDALALVWALLAILDSLAIGNYSQLIQVCNEYTFLLKRRIESGLREQVIDYLAMGAEEIYTYANALQNGWGNSLLDSQKGIRCIVRSGLNTVVMLLCDQWSPDPKISGKGAGNYEASFNC